MLWRMQDRTVHLKGFGHWAKDESYMAADHVETSEPDEIEEPAEDVTALL